MTNLAYRPKGDDPLGLFSHLEEVDAPDAGEQFHPMQDSIAPVGSSPAPRGDDPLGLFSRENSAPASAKDYYTWEDQLAAGADTGQAVAWEGANQAAKYFGFSGSEFQKLAEKQAAENMAEAKSIPALNLWDQVLRGAGTVAVAAPAVIAGGLAGLTVGAGASGLAVAGAITSAGMNLGDEAFKAKELDPKWEAETSDIVMNSALGLAELIPATRMFKALKAAKPALGESFTKSLAKSLPSFTANTASAGLVEGVQDFATGYKAYTSTDTPITPEVVDGLVDSMITEAAVGSLLAGPIASVPLIGEIATRMSPERVKWEVDPETGEKVNFTFEAPVQNVASDNGLVAGITSGFTTLTGRAADGLNLVFGKNPATTPLAWKEIREKFAMNETERERAAGEGRFTVTQDIERNMLIADLDRGAHDGFWRAPAAIADAAVEAKMNGLRVVEDPAVQKALDGIWAMDANTKAQAAATPGLKFIPRGDTYVPSMPDPKAITEADAQYIEDARQDLIEQGVPEPEIADYITKQVEPYLENMKKYGQPMQDTSISDRAGAYLAEQFAKLSTITDPAKRAAKARAINYSMATEELPKIFKDNPLELDRQLGRLSDKFHQKYSKKVSAHELYRAHNVAAASRMVHVRNWGPNNEKYWKKVGEAITQAHEAGVEVPGTKLSSFVDLINTAQNQSIKHISARERRTYETIRSIEYVTKLPLAIIPSIVESIFILDKYGTASGLTEMGRVLFQGMAKKVAGKKPPAARQELLDSLNMSMREATSIVAARMGDPTMSPSKIDTWFFNNVTYLPQFTEMLRMVAAFQAEHAIRDAIAGLQSTDKGEIQRSARKLYQAGVDPNRAMAWGENYNDPYYLEVIRPATIALAEDVVVHPTPSKKPLWHGNPRLMLISQMKGFTTVFTNTVMKTWWKRMVSEGDPIEKVAYAAQIFPVLATFVAMQSGLTALREWIKTGDTENWDALSFQESMTLGVSYLGWPGIGIEAVHGTGWGRSAVESVLGPAAGDTTKLSRAVVKAFEDPAGALNDILQMGIPSWAGSGILKNYIEEGLTSGNN